MQLLVDRLRGLPEIREASLMGEPGQIIDGLAERLDRCSMHQRRKPDSAVDDHGADRVLQQSREVEIVNIVNPVGHPESPGRIADQAPVIAESAVERMVFENQVAVCWRRRGEGADDLSNESTHVSVATMHHDLGILVYL